MRNMDPSFHAADHRFGLAYVHKGLAEQAIAVFDTALKASPGSVLEINADLGYTHAVMGKRVEAVRRLAYLKDAAALSPRVGAYYCALVCAGLGQKDEAIEWLQRAYSERF